MISHEGLEKALKEKGIGKDGIVQETRTFYTNDREEKTICCIQAGFRG